jgi:hypothetical protein
MRCQIAAGSSQGRTPKATLLNSVPGQFLLLLMAREG